MRRYLISSIAALAVVVAAVPSQAVRHNVYYGMQRGVTVSVNLAGGGIATGSVTRFDSVEFEAEGTARPTPAQNVSYLGCISIKTSVGSDSSCAILKGADVFFDPALDAVTASWSVDSKLFPKKSPPVRLLAVLILRGAGAHGLIAQPKITPDTDSEDRSVTIDGGPQVGRPMTVSGRFHAESKVGTKVIGGGAVTSTKSATAWYGPGGRIFVACKPTPQACPADEA